MTDDGLDWSFGRVAFETYRNAVGGKTYDGKPIPGWDSLTEIQQAAWDLAAQGVIEEYKHDDVNGEW